MCLHTAQRLLVQHPSPKAFTLTWQKFRQLILPEEASRHDQRQSEEEHQTQLGPFHLHLVGFGEPFEFNGGRSGLSGSWLEHKQTCTQKRTPTHHRGGLEACGLLLIQVLKNKRINKSPCPPLHLLLLTTWAGRSGLPATRESSYRSLSTLSVCSTTVNDPCSPKAARGVPGRFPRRAPISHLPPSPL